MGHSEFATGLGFAGVMAGPLALSSYRAGRLHAQAMVHHGGPLPAGQAHLAEEGSASQEAGSLIHGSALHVPYGDASVFANRMTIL